MEGNNEPLSNKAIVVATCPIPNLGEYIVKISLNNYC